MYLCPLCDKPIGEHDDTCKSCGANLANLREVGILPQKADGTENLQMKACPHCGNEIRDDETHCPYCSNATGTAQQHANASPTYQAAPAQQPQAQQSSGFNGMALAGLLCSLFAGPILGLIFSILGLKKAATMNGSGRGQAITGLVFSIIGFVFTFIYIIVYAIMLTSLAGGYY